MTPLPAALVVATALSLAACAAFPRGPVGSGGTPPVTTGSGSPMTSAPVTTGTSPTSSGPAAVPVARTTATLQQALLALTDMPTGYAVEPPPSDPGGGQATLSSKDPQCATFVSLAKAPSAPGALASATVAYSGGQGGPYIEESIDALDSAGSVARLQSTFQAAIASCPKVTLSVPGQGTSPATVRPVSAPPIGNQPVAARLTADSGALHGLELTIVTTGVADTVLSMTFVAAYPEEIDSAARAAVEKATQTLGAGTAGLS